jgi:replicative superfamily II helicase
MNKLNTIAMMVVDELQMITDKERGIIIESFLTKILLRL